MSVIVVVVVDLDGDGDLSANRYEIARGEAMECAAALDVMKLRELITEERYQRGTQLLEGVVAMLPTML